jgi:hypothetical protein
MINEYLSCPTTLGVRVLEPFAFLLCLQFLLPLPLMGNDGAAEVALGGIRLKQERRVAMAKERLFISKKMVRVDYDFLNDSKEDVVTEIAFPIPDYWCNPGLGWTPFDDFKVWVNDTACPFQIEAKAYVKDMEITAALQKMGIRISTFGDWEEGRISHKENTSTPSKSQLHSLSNEQLAQLIALGAIEKPHPGDPFGFLPLWTVRKTYHWTQTFPAGQVVRIRHEYSPALGDFNNITLEALQQPTPNSMLPAPGCPDETFRKSFTKLQPKWKKLRGFDGIPGNWVSYILKTANTWKTPILDFELIVERDAGELVTFCWDGPVEKTGANTFRARVKGFIPGKDLTVYFVQP